MNDESRKPWDSPSGDGDAALRAEGPHLAGEGLPEPTAQALGQEPPQSEPSASQDQQEQEQHSGQNSHDDADSTLGAPHDAGNDAPEATYSESPGSQDEPAEVAAIEESPTEPLHEEGREAPAHAAESNGSAASGEMSVDEASEEQVSGDEAPKSEQMDWYILKVQSNREESIRDGLLRRVKIAGLEHYFDEVVVPTEPVSEYKDGKRRTRKQKIWPGYLVIHMEINEDTWFLVRETPGIGDFTGSGGKPTPMKAAEVEKILRLVHPEKHAAKEKAPVKIAFEIGDRVKIKEGTFQNFDGEVGAIDHTNGRVTVMTEIFNRKTPVELDYWQVERI